MAKKSTPAPDPDTLLQLNPDDILMVDNSRYQATVPADEAEAMRASILSVGRIMEPVGVTRLDKPVDGAHYQLRYGFRRVAGAILANAEGAGVMVPALVLEEADPQGVLREQVTENVVRKSLSLMDTAVAARKMLDAGIERPKVREIFTRPAGTRGGGIAPASEAWLNMILSLLDFPASIQERIHNNDIGLGAAYRLSKAPADKWEEILKRAEGEVESVRTTEEKEEKKFAELEGKIQEATTKETEAVTKVDHAKIELELAEKRLAEVQDEAKSLYAKEQAAQVAVQQAKPKEKKAAQDKLKKASEARKAAETDAKTFEGKRIVAVKTFEMEQRTATKHQTAAQELQEKLDAMRAKAPVAATPKKKAKITASAVDKGAKAAGVDTGTVKLKGPEMRKFIEDLALNVSYPKVAAIGNAIKEHFAGVTTEKQVLTKLSGITGEKAAAKK